MANPFARIPNRPLSYDRLHGIRKCLGVFKDLNSMYTAYNESNKTIDLYAILNDGTAPKVYKPVEKSDGPAVYDNSDDKCNPDRDSSLYNMPDFNRFSYVMIQNVWYEYVYSRYIDFDSIDNYILIDIGEESLSTVRDIEDYIAANGIDISNIDNRYYIIINDNINNLNGYYVYLRENDTTETGITIGIGEEGWYPCFGWMRTESTPDIIEDGSLQEITDSDFVCPIEKELIIDYTNHIMYICDVNRDIVQISTLKDVVKDTSEDDNSSINMSVLIKGSNWETINDDNGDLLYYKYTINIKNVYPEDIPTIALLSSLDIETAKKEKEEYNKLYRVTSGEDTINLYMSEEPSKDISYNINIQVIR